LAIRNKTGSSIDKVEKQYHLLIISFCLPFYQSATVKGGIPFKDIGNREYLKGFEMGIKILIADLFHFIVKYDNFKE